MSADANRVALRYRVETTFGEVPAGSSVFQDLRYTGESLKADTNTTASQEIRDDGQIPDIIRTGLSGSGSINGELSYGTYDDFIEAALGSSGWSTAESNQTVSCTFAASAGTVTDAATTGAFANYSAGEWLYFSGFAESTNNGFKKIVSKTSDNIIVVTPAVVDDVADSGDIVHSSQVTQGTTARTFTIEKEFADLSSEFAHYRGFGVNTWNVNVTPDAIITTDFGFLGKDVVSATGSADSGTPTQATPSDILNAIDDVEAIYYGTNAINATSFSLTAFNFSTNLNLRSRLQIGTLGAISLGRGNFAPTGSFSAFYDGKTVLDNYLNFTDFSLAFIVHRNSEAYVFDFPGVKITDGSRNAEGINTDVVGNYNFECHRYATEDVTMRVARFADTTP